MVASRSNAWSFFGQSTRTMSLSGFPSALFAFRIVLMAAPCFRMFSPYDEITWSRATERSSVCCAVLIEFHTCLLMIIQVMRNCCCQPGRCT